MPDKEKINYLNIELKPIRYRYPILSEQVQDLLDGIYWNLTELIGYEHEDGTMSPSGYLTDLYNELDDLLGTHTGAQASGYSAALALSSGYIDNITTVNMANLKSTEAMIRYYRGYGV
jgi:hypothetical protein